MGVIKTISLYSVCMYVCVCDPISTYIHSENYKEIIKIVWFKIRVKLLTYS